MDASGVFEPEGAAVSPGAKRKRSPWERQNIALTWSLLSLPLVAMVVLFLAPLAVLLWISFGGWADAYGFEGYGKLGAPVYLRLLLFTLKLALTVTIACAVLAYPISFLMVCYKGTYAKLMALGLFVSLWLSLLARTFAWIVILQRNGILNSILMASGIVDEPVPLVYNQTGVYIGMIHIMLPFMIVTLAPVMAAIDDAYIKAGLSLGAKPFQVFRQIYLPLSLPGIVAGSILVFALAFGFYVTPAILGGGRTPTIVLAVKDQIQKFGDLQLAAATSMVLLFICLSILIFYDRVVGVDRILQRGGH
ncbi:ABC transporter permease [Pseudoruegeria sp. HB172150]|uniref:ABC transporter permease n=1 Tax=Pseudoruegeria sp. HB172150 TaxID=2721164 RepID=UPI00155475DD|nr:ABC transporter permease [Pseudoruegeria sp. HB172150]